MQYVELCFENAGEKRTQEIMLNLEDAGIGYEHITGQAGNLVGCISNKLDFETFKDKAENVVHDHNDGMWCEIESKTEEQVDHLL